MFKTFSRFLFGLLFIGAGIEHFIDAGFFESIVPPYLPWPAALVAISGVAEIVLGVAVMIRPVSRYAAWGLILLLLAVFPANIHMATHPADYPTFAPLLLWLRLPLQAVLAAWAYCYTRPILIR